MLAVSMHHARVAEDVRVLVLDLPARPPGSGMALKDPHGADWEFPWWGRASRSCCTRPTENPPTRSDPSGLCAGVRLFKSQASPRGVD